VEKVFDGWIVGVGEMEERPGTSVYAPVGMGKRSSRIASRLIVEAIDGSAAE